MKIIAREKAEQNEAAVDPWTAVHLASGLGLGLMDVPLPWAVAASVAYEAVEQVVERQAWGRTLFRTERPESPANAVVDLVAFVMGHRLGAAWNRTDRR